MSKTTMQQEGMTIEIVGEVTGPPTLEDLLASLAEIVPTKQAFTLTPGQVRVLHDYLDANLTD